MARADEVVKFRYVGHATSIQSQEVGDVDNHVLILARWSGIALLPDESAGNLYWTVLSDYTKGVGSFSSYVNLTFKDGSVLWYKATGTGKPEGATSQFLGSVSVLGGKGRFDGAKGDGTLSGARIGPPETGSNQYGELVINVKK
jgi:hypothetical protein